jgi:hypothetical protein
MLLICDPARAVQEGLFDRADDFQPRCADAADRSAQVPLRPRYGVICRRLPPAVMETAPGVSVALLTTTWDHMLRV